MTINQTLLKLSSNRRRLEGAAHDRSKELVSICIPNYNKVSWVEECLDSVAAQTYKNIEIIVVDDCSSDGSQDKLSKIQKKYASKVNIVTLFLPRRTGTAWAQNMAYYLSKGEFVSNCDSDDLFHPDKIKRQLELLKEQDLDMVGTNFSIFLATPTKPTTPCGGHWLKYEPKAIEKSYLSDNIHCVCFGTLLFKFKVIEKICGMNKDLIGTEDYEFVARAIRSGFRVGNSQEILYHYRTSSTQRSRLFHGSQV